MRWMQLLLFILGNFLPFYPLNSPKNENFKKNGRKHLEIFYTIVPKVMIIGFTLPEIWHVTDVIVIFHFGPFFALLPPNSPKNEHFRKMKKALEIWSLYTSVSKIMIICYTVPEIWHVTHVISIFHFVPFNVLLPT